MTAVMSISLNVVRCAVACCDSSRCSAIRLRRVVIFSRVSRWSVAGSGRRGAAGGADGAAADGARLGRRGARRLGHALDHVGLADDAAATRALNRREIHALLGGNPLRRGRCANLCRLPAAAGAGAAGRRRRRGCSRRGGAGAGAAAAAGAAARRRCLSSISASSSSTLTTSPSACARFVNTPHSSPGLRP